MSNTLSGLTPAQTFQGLIKVGNNTNVDGTAKVLSDGSGNDLPMEVSTTGVNFTGTLTQNGQPVTTPPSGGAGLIQFSDGSAFASDSNLFWDNTNKRLGVGTNAPLFGLDVSQNISGGLFARLQNTNFGGFGMLLNAGSGVSTYTMQWANYLGSGGGRIYPEGVYIGQQAAPTARLQVRGSGSTSATTSLLVQNSSGAELLKVQDNGKVSLGGLGFEGGIISGNPYFSGTIYGPNIYIQSSGAATFGAASGADSSAQMDVRSTTKGFLPPRMTTTQKNAISSPASGLMVYDTSTNKLCCYNGTSWNDLF